MSVRSVDALTSGVGAVLLGILVFLLIERELLRQIEPSWVHHSPSAFNVAIVPLLVAFIAIVAVRFVALS